jgi:spermidine/putrescine transport system ATP-binding protein
MTDAPSLVRAPSVQEATPTVTGGAVRLVSLAKDFDGLPAVRGIDLDIASGEFFSLLGPSGCGKTTTLRMIAGFERPSGGQILLDGNDLSQVPPHRRPVNTVFQSYALFPFMNVRDNVAFGLRYAGLTRAQTRARCDEALALVRMGEYARRRPAQLSGGQQQRVALARALVLNPRVLLLDEPLGALDAKLRKTLQLELKALQESVGITFVYVTHDQDEALTMSDRLAVMAGGRVEQVGTPEEVYERPSTAYVADFLGAANLVPVEALGPGEAGMTVYRLDGVTLSAGPPEHVAGPATLVIRPERVRLAPAEGADPEAAQDHPGETVTGVVERLVFRGATVEVAVLTAGGTRLVALFSADRAHAYHAGQRVRVILPSAMVRLLPPGGTSP